MSMFSHSQLSSSSRGFPSVCRNGFSLIELLISVAILALISTVVLIRFSSFDSTVLLKGLAYEIATSLREAQVFSLSVRRDNVSGTFRTPYGMTFTPGSKTYALFVYSSNDRPNHDANFVDINTITIGRSIEVYDVCVKEPAVNCGISRLDISFKRPDFDALFFVEGYTEAQNSSIAAGMIKVRAQDGGASSAVWIVEVSITGQISVSKE